MNIETITSEISEPLLQQNWLKISFSQTSYDQNKVSSTLQFIQDENHPDCLFIMKCIQSWFLCAIKRQVYLKGIMPQ